MSFPGRLRGLLCVLLLPLHTVFFALAGIAVGVLRPQGHGVMAVARAWSRVILLSGGIRVRGVHADRMPPGACVLVANHQSLFDVPALMVVLPTRFRMVAKRELFRVPVFGWALSLGGFIPVDRARRQHAIASLSQAADGLRKGTSILIFVEGTRSRDGNLKPLKKGAFRLAQEAGVPLLPITLSGSRAVLARDGWFPRSGAIDVVMGLPQDPAPPGESVEASLLRIRTALQAGYTANHIRDLEGAGTHDG